MKHEGMKPVFYDTTHTSHCDANTGIQRVVRRIFREWPVAGGLLPVVYDSYGENWRRTDDTEGNLLKFSEGRMPGVKRGSRWSLPQKFRGYRSRFTADVSVGITGGASGFLCAEAFGPDRDDAVFHRLRKRVDGPFSAIFYDTIALQLPELTPRQTTVRFEAYLEKLLRFDRIFAISEYSRDCLANCWKERGVAITPELFALPLGVDVPAVRPGMSPQRDDTPLILCVGTLEGRKNHVALLAACESLWRAGCKFRLRLIGTVNAETGSRAVAAIAQLQAAGRPVEWLRRASDEELFQSYAECLFTVYPSLLEGFGLPVLESLACGRPCVCSGLNAMAEVVRDGGCLAVGVPDVGALTSGIRLLLDDAAARASLLLEINRRSIKSWSEYTSDLNRLIHA